MGLQVQILRRLRTLGFHCLFLVSKDGGKEIHRHKSAMEFGILQETFGCRRFRLNGKGVSTLEAL